LVDVVNHGAPHADFRTSSVKPRTRGVSRGFRFRLGGTCDGEGKTHHNRCSTPAVSSEQHPRLLALLAILSPRCGHALSFLWVARFARRRWGTRVTVSARPWAFFSSQCITARQRHPMSRKVSTPIRPFASHWGRLRSTWLNIRRPLSPD